jgi:hypothetical protein
LNFLALTNQDLGLTSAHLVGVVHGPGLVCMRCQADLSVGVVLKQNGTLELLGRECASGYAPGPWFQALQIGKHYLTLAQLRADQSLKPRQRQTLRGLAVRLQLEPDHLEVRELHNQLLAGQALSAAQASRAEGCLAEMGGLPPMLVARNQMRRLSILGALPRLSWEAESQVSSLLGRLLRLEYLSEKQNRLIYALQDQEVSAVLTYTTQLLRAWPPIGGWLWKLA